MKGDVTIISKSADEAKQIEDFLASLSINVHNQLATCQIIKQAPDGDYFYCNVKEQKKEDFAIYLPKTLVSILEEDDHYLCLFAKGDIFPLPVHFILPKNDVPIKWSIEFFPAH